MNQTEQPLHPVAAGLEPVNGGLSSYPPVQKWDDWVEYDTAHWPRKVEKHYQIIPTICFNCEAACGLLSYRFIKGTFMISSRPPGTVWMTSVGNTLLFFHQIRMKFGLTPANTWARQRNLAPRECLMRKRLFCDNPFIDGVRERHCPTCKLE